MAFGFVVDSNNVFGKTVEEAGSYNVKILDSTNFTTAKTGKDMLVLNYEVIDGKYAGGQIRYHNLVWDESSQEAYDLSVKRFNTMAVALGVNDGYDFGNTSTTQFANMIKGKKLNVTVDWSENNHGKYNLNVTAQNMLNKDGSKPNGVFRPTQTKTTQNGFNSFQTGNQVKGNSFGANNTAPQATNNAFTQAKPTNSSDPFASNSNSIEISDNDLPF